MQKHSPPPPDEADADIEPAFDETAAGRGQPAENAQPSTDADGAELERARQKITELEDAFLRAKAEADNVRRRAQADIANAHKFSLESFAAELLAVKDSLEAALAIDNATAQAMRSGAELTLKQLSAALEKSNVKEVNPLGERFDPHRHEAIAMAEADAPANTVTRVLQKGYLLHDRVLRPALVMVSKGRANAETPSQNGAPTS